MADKEPTLFETINRISHEINDDIHEALLLRRRDKVAELCDKYGQFMCDVTQEMLSRAKAVEQFTSKYPECEVQLSALAKNFRDSAQEYSALYSSFERRQRIGEVPTSLPDFV